MLIVNGNHCATMSGCNTDKSAIIPRLLTRQQAAAYCGVSIPTFDGICPVKAIALGTGKRLERFDRISLDGWINSLTGGGLQTRKDWLTELDNS